MMREKLESACLEDLEMRWTEINRLLCFCNKFEETHMADIIKQIQKGHEYLNIEFKDFLLQLVNTEVVSVLYVETI